MTGFYEGLDAGGSYAYAALVVLHFFGNAYKHFVLHGLPV